MAVTGLVSINPSTGGVISVYDYHTQDEVDKIVLLTSKAQLDWKMSEFSQRAAILKEIAANLRKDIDKLARLITLEMGKPIAQSEAEVLKCAMVCDFYADNGEDFLRSEPVKTEAQESYIAFRPLGIILSIMPWNFPYWQVFRFAAPALMAGNGVLLKHASNVTGAAMAIENIFMRSGLPQNLFRALRVSSRDIGRVIENNEVKAVTLTGSVEAGKAVAAKAGSELKKSVLELGGSDPYIILDDADLKKAVSLCVKSRLVNSGQSCIAAKRFIVVKPVIEEFTKLFVKEMSSKVMGDPFDNKSDIGPMASESLRDELHLQVVSSVKAGAECLLGGYVPELAGAWYPPTVLVNVKPGMPAYDDEIFGPVASIIAAADISDAIKIANDTQFGLGASVFTSNSEVGKLIAEVEMEAGCCFVNDFVRSDPRLPFGGIGWSGYGRELSAYGIKEFTNIKSVYIK